MILIDSDILIEVTRARDIAIVSRWLDLSHSSTEILYSPVSEAELWAGARPNEYEILSQLFESLTCVPITSAIGKQAGDYLRKFAGSHSLELGDALIAASAQASGSTLWTRNRKHYPMKELRFF